MKISLLHVFNSFGLFQNLIFMQLFVDGQQIEIKLRIHINKRQRLHSWFELAIICT